MKFTGERMIPEYNQGESIYLEHVSRYFFASQFVKNKVVLDIACGSGYGAGIFLKRGAKKVIGVDIAEESIDYCNNKYFKREKTKFIVGDVGKIPLNNASVDVVVSFETIEHVGDISQKNFLKEVKRVLKPGGMLIVSTPNTLVAPKGNPYHVKELSPKEFNYLLKENFSYINTFYQDDFESTYIFSKGQLIKGEEKVNSGRDCINVNRIINFDAQKSLFLIAVCSDKKENVIMGKIDGELTISGIKPWIMHQRFEGKIKQMKHGIEQKEREIKQANLLIKQKEKEIEFIKSSIFWRMRKIYMKLKSVLKVKK